MKISPVPLLLLCLPSLFAAPTSAPAVSADSSGSHGFEFVRNIGGIVEYRLPVNDLNVLLIEDHSAPVLTFMVTYRVGSRNEVTGTTGATHLLEHLMFKGSKNFHAGIGKGFDTLMDRVGGINNATTWLDRTNYYEILSSNHLELAVQLEADRMRNLLLREEDRQPEMTVVRNEFERGENDPLESLDKEITAAAFIAHPYHHSTIGWRSDIEKVSIEKLREFYDTFYWPNNATISVIGDFQPNVALDLIGRHFGAIPRAPHPIPQVYTEEPPQTGPRRVVVRRPGEVGVVQVAFKVPHARHTDHAPLDVLAAVLSTGKTSRFYRAMIDTNLAISANAGKGFFHDDTLFTVNAMLAPGTTHQKAEQTLLAEIAQVQDSGVTPAEVGRAINKLLAGIAYGRDGSFAIAGQINEAIAVGDWTLYLTLLDKIKAVTPADVQRVAKAYLVEDQGTTGWFIPQPEPAAEPTRVGGGDECFGTGALARSDQRQMPPGSSRGPHYYRDPAEPVSARSTSRLAANLPRQPSGPPAPAGGGTLVAPKVQRRTVAGVDVLTLKTSIEDVVTIRGVVGAGDVFNPPGQSAIADLTAGMLDKGTAGRDKFALAEVLEQVGATLNFGTGSHTLNFTAKCLRQDLPLVLALLAEQLRSPRFDPVEFDKLKQQFIGRHKRQMEDTGYRAETAFLRAIFPDGHPNRPPADDQYLADIQRATLDEVKAFHAANYGPAAARLVAVGDLDDAAIDNAVREAFTGWRGGRPIPPAPKAAGAAIARLERVMMPGKTSVSYVVGQPSGLRYADPEYQALNFGTAVLGSGFFSARLLDIIRNREGLTYGIGATLSADTYTDGAWYIEGTFSPELLPQGVASVQRELQRFHDEGLSAEELANFKVTLTGTYKVALSTTGGLANALLNALQRGYGPEWIDDYPQKIEALTLAQVNEAIRKFLKPDAMVRVMAGTLPAEMAVGP